jgi:16S rRNA C1402 (ribose-2'-O) methylase RsmI
MALAVPVGVTCALAIALSAAVLATTLTTFSTFLSAVSGRRRTSGF